MKVLIVAHEAKFNGGANRALFALIEYWHKNKTFELEVLVPESNGGMIDSLKELGIPVHVSKYFKIFTEKREDGKDILRCVKLYAKYLYNYLKTYIIAKKLRNRKYDLVYSNTRMTTAGGDIAKALKIPYVIHIREFGNENTIWGPNNIRRISGQAKKIIVITKALGNYLMTDSTKEKFIVSHDGVKKVTELPEKPDNNTKNIRLLLTGRISEAKGQDEAVEAVHILKERGITNIELYFAGSMAGGTAYERKYLDKLYAMIEKYDLGNQVKFLGEVSDMSALRAEIDIELMCSLCETFGWVTVEGMRAGLFLIGTNTGGTPEIITDGKTGLLYQQGNASELADKIEWALNNKDEVEHITKEGQKFANSHFTVEQNAEEVYQVIRQVHDSRKVK